VKLTEDQRSSNDIKRLGLRSILVLLTCFLGSEAIVGPAAAFIKVYGLKLMDPKCLDVPQIAFEIELLGILFFFVVSTVCIGFSIIFLKDRLVPSRPKMFQFAVLGALYPILGWIIGEALIIVVNEESMVLPIIG